MRFTRSSRESIQPKWTTTLEIFFSLILLVSVFTALDIFKLNGFQRIDMYCDKTIFILVNRLVSMSTKIQIALTSFLT